MTGTGCIGGSGPAVATERCVMDYHSTEIILYDWRRQGPPVSTRRQPQLHLNRPVRVIDVSTSHPSLSLAPQPHNLRSSFCDPAFNRPGAPTSSSQYRMVLSASRCSGSDPPVPPRTATTELKRMRLTRGAFLMVKGGGLFIG